MSTVRIRGARFYYEERNVDEKDAILLIHGHPFDHTMWIYQYEALKNFHLVVPDLKGYGKSDFRFEKIFIEEQALDMAILLDGLGIRKVHLIGLSMGAQIALEFSRLFPDRTRSMVFCDSLPEAEDERTYSARLQLAERIQFTGMKAYTEDDIHKYLHPNTLLLKGTVYKHLYEMMVSTRSEGAAASHKGRAERRDGTAFLPKIQFPVLVLVGEGDYFSPPVKMQLMAEQIPGSRFEIIEGAGHMPNMEQPHKFNESIVAFYDSIAQKGTAVLK